MIRSLRTRLILGTTIASILVFALAAFILYAAIRRSLQSEFDQTLSVRAQALAAITEQGKDGVHLDVEPNQITRLSLGDAYAIYGADGKIVNKSQEFSGADFQRMHSSGGPYIPDQSLFDSPASTGHPHVRYIIWRFSPHQEEDDTKPVPQQAEVVFVRSAANLDYKLSQLTWLLAAAFGGSAILAAIIMALIIRRGLRPLSTLARTIHTIDPDTLSTRISLPNSPKELDPVLARLNDLLSRLEASFNRERAFTADVAHELRTPLAGIVAALEVARTQPRPAADLERTIDRCLPVSRAMRSMIENLLTLARADAHQLPIASEPIDLTSLLHSTWSPFADAAAARNLQLQWNLPATLPLHSDPNLLSLILRNLFDNAVSYTNDAGTISVTASPNTLRITNSGSQIPADSADQVFHPFWRGDQSRSSQSQHSGLGLALCQRTCKLLNINIQAQSAPGKDFTITLQFPPGRGGTGTPEAKKAQQEILKLLRPLTNQA